ncbi:MAG: DUF3383 domain-containing protein, partial [Clostridiales bacterium]|nr:DUF3383 domain-containing protein [Clostridiales bacterium]
MNHPIKFTGGFFVSGFHLLQTSEPINERRLSMLSTDTIARVVLNLTSASAGAAAFDTGLLLVKPGTFTTEKRMRAYSSATEAAAGMIADGFPVTSDEYKAGLKYFAASPTPGKLLVSGSPASESLPQALAAVLERTQDFYGVLPVVSGMTTQDWLDLAAAIESATRPLMLFAAVTGTPAEATAANSLLDKLYARGSRRVVPFYCSGAPDAAALMGTAMGLERKYNASGTSFTLCYKQVNGIEPSDLTQAQVDAIKEKNGNVFVVRGYSHLL